MQRRHELGASSSSSHKRGFHIDWRIFFSVENQWRHSKTCQYKKLLEWRRAITDVRPITLQFSCGPLSAHGTYQQRAWAEVLSHWPSLAEKLLVIRTLQVEFLLLVTLEICEKNDATYIETYTYMYAPFRSSLVSSAHNWYAIIPAFFSKLVLTQRHGSELDRRDYSQASFLAVERRAQQFLLSVCVCWLYKLVGEQVHARGPRSDIHACLCWNTCSRK